MGMMRGTLTALALCPFAAHAMDISCSGTDPDWDISVTGETAQFNYGKSADMTVPQRGSAENRDWPQVLTLLGSRDTAIVILHQRACDTAHVTAWPVEATVLTQKTETPVVLSGCCLPAS